MPRSMILIGLLVTACASPGASPSQEGPGDPQGSWQLVAGASNGVDLPVPADHPITLILEPSSMGGTAACNIYGAEFSLSGEGIEIGDIEQTLRGCEEAVEAAETAYLSALRNVTRIGMDRDRLVLTGPGIELRFDRLPEPPTADLVGTTWTLDTLFVGDVAAAPMGEPATLELRDDGTFSGTTGCRTFNGTWTERGNQILATAMDLNELECAPDLADQDGHVVSVIGDGFVPSVEDGLLTLLDPGGVGLVYRSSE